MTTKFLLAIAAVCGMTLAASAQPRIGINLRIGVPVPIIVREAPPRPVVVEYREVAPSPGPNYVWVRAHHRWVEGRWVPIEGGWVVPPQPDAIWVEGRWDEPTRAWTEEHWEISRPMNVAPNGPPPPPGPTVRVEVREGDRGSAEFFVGSAPPPMREERMSRRPSREHVWIAGYWSANKGRHEWVAGRWEVPPHGRSAWVAPRWEQHDHNYLFVQGYWK